MFPIQCYADNDTFFVSYFSRLLAVPLERVYNHTSTLDVEVYPHKQRNKSEAVPEGNGPVPQQQELGSGQSTLADVYRRVKKVFEEVSGRKMDKFTDNLRRNDQLLASLEQDARQPRLAMAANVQADIKTPERTEGTAIAVPAMHGDSFSTNRADPGPKTTWTSFGVKTNPPALPCRDDVLVENGAAAPKSCLAPLEMRTATAAGSLLPIVKTTTATWTILDRQLFGST